MKWIGRATLAVLSLLVLARAASAQQAYPVPPGYVKASNPQDYLPGYPEGGIPIRMGADGRYYAQDGYGQIQGGYAQGGMTVVSEGCCGGSPYPQPQPYPVPPPAPQSCCASGGAYGGGYQGGGYPPGVVVVVEETCCGRSGAGGYSAPASSLIPPGYVPIGQYVETVPCGGGCGGGYPPPAPPSCCAPPSPPPSCDWRRPHDPRDPYACPPGWGEVRLNDSFFWGGGGVGPEYIPGGGRGGGYAYAGAGAGAYAYANASASVRVNVGGRYGHKPPYRPPHRPPHKKGCGGCR